MDTNTLHAERDENGMTPRQRERNDIVVRKAEKLTTATYMVSDIIPDREPVKWKMRETAIELLSDITLSATASASERLSYLRNVVKKIEKMVSFLDIAWTTRMLSEMNASILREEFLGLRGMIEGELRELLSGSFDRGPALPPMYKREERKQEPMPVRERPAAFAGSERRSFVAPVTPAAPRTLPERTEREVSAPQPAERQVVPPRELPQPPRPTPVSRPTYQHHEEESSRIGRDDRRKIIQALLKQRSKLTVKDIAKSIPGFSEKTIQRELVAMLGDGIVVKEGEKRWTTYSLPQGQ
jgi:DNA-binding transcriptional ArsR family regulator